MGVTCQILFNKPKGGHAPGQPVSGVVKYAVDKPLEVKNVVLSFTGKGYCSWEESTTNGNVTESKSHSGNETYYDACINVIERKKGEEIVTIPVGAYEFPFEFLLPNNLPPSYKSYSANITYMVLLNFERPGLFKFNKRFSAEIPIGSCIESDEVLIVFGLDKTLTKPFSSRKHVVNLKAAILKSSWVPGDKIPLSLVVTNDNSLTLTAIRTELIRYETLTTDCGSKKYGMFVVKECTVGSTSIPKDSIVNLNQEIQTLPNMYSVTNSKIISVIYKLKVTVRLPVPYINAHVEIPILIGEKLVESSEEDPPSYWEVVCEEEKKCDSTMPVLNMKRYENETGWI